MALSLLPAAWLGRAGALSENVKAKIMSML
jgi:hypothetical protein